jgi:hypothetical protein
MVFAHDTEVALQHAAALVNTVEDGEEHLPDVEALATFVRDWGWSGAHAHTDTELRAVRELRPRMRRIWEIGEDEAVEIVNRLLREGAAAARQARRLGLPPARHAAGRPAGHADGGGRVPGPQGRHPLTSYVGGTLASQHPTTSTDGLLDVYRGRIARWSRSASAVRHG